MTGKKGSVASAAAGARPPYHSLNQSETVILQIESAFQLHTNTWSGEHDTPPVFERIWTDSSCLKINRVMLFAPFSFSLGCDVSNSLFLANVAVKLSLLCSKHATW